MYAEPREKYCHMYFEVTDLTVGELEKCFDQKDLGIVRDPLLLEFANE